METLAAIHPHVLAGIAYDPTIRGVLATVVGVGVLIGSIYLLLGTNLGNRLGFLIALTGFFGWMAILGLSWWIYGIGIKGDAPEWRVVEFNADDTSAAATEEVRSLDVSLLPQEDGAPDYEGVNILFEEDPAAFKEIEENFEDATGGWKFLPPSAASRAEAEASVSAALPACDACDFGIEEAADFTVLGGFEVGGKDGLPDNPTIWDRVWTKIESALTLTNPEHYAVIQVQKVIDQEPVPGEAPPTPEPDLDEPVISVVLIRDIGNLRLPSAMITLGSTLIFLVLAWMLNQREKVLEANIAAAEAAAKAGA